MQQRNTLRIESLLLNLWVFTLPTSMALRWRFPASSLFGNPVEYLIPGIYLFDITSLVAAIYLVFSSGVFNDIIAIFKKAITQPTTQLVLLLFAYLLWNALVISQWPLLSVYWLARLSISTLVVLQIRKHYALATFLQIIRPGIWVTILTQTAVAIYQCIVGSSVFGYIFFGEPDLTSSRFVAHSQLSQYKQVLAYGTTPHPNILAGILSVLFVCLMLLNTKNSRSPHNLGQKMIILGLFLLNILLTESWSVLVATTLVITILKTKNLHNYKTSHAWKGIIALPLILLALAFTYHSSNLFANTSISRRYELLSLGAEMIRLQPVFGVGLQQQLPYAVAHLASSFPTGFIQPIHNVYSILLVETGLVGAIIIIAILATASKTHRISRRLQLAPLCILMLIGLWDHYIITLPIGISLVSFSALIASLD